MDNIVYLEYEKVCRTCLAITELQSLFIPRLPSNNSLINMIMTCTSVQIKENDGFPMNICTQCVNELTRAFHFKTRCESIDRKFHLGVILNSNTVKEEPHFGFENDDNLTEEKSLSFGLKSVNSTQIKFETLDEKLNVKKTGVKDITTKRKYKKYNKVKCNVCEKEIAYRRKSIHMRTHTKEKPYDCKECGRKFATGSNLSRHIKIHTGEKSYQCNICGHSFIQAVTLQAHLIVHSKETPYVCDYCGKAFKQYKLCQLHKSRMHLNLETDATTMSASEYKNKSQKNCPFVCDLCNHRFRYKMSLHLHRKKHVHGKTFLCSVCGKSFFTKHNLDSHQITHSGLKPYSCTVCNKSFGHKSALFTHNLVHTGEKRYNCTVCDKKFRQRPHLQSHLRVHNGVKTHVCSFCGKSFFQKGNLTVHVRIHTGEMPYVCSLCEKGFHDSRSWKKHERKHKI